MGLPFPSEEWISAYKDAINGNPAYRTAAADWTYGVVALICRALPPGLPLDTGIWLDLEKGVCRDAKLVRVEEAMKAPFCITGEYARWKQVLKKELDPIKGMMQGKLKLKGDLPTIVRAVKAAEELVNSGGHVDTRFLDE
jgi:putative sterol carrier protein